MFNKAWLAGGIPRTACVAAYEPVCAVSLADSYINRANPGTNDAAPGVAPTWAAETGWTFNGFQYLKTGVVPANDQSWSVIARYDAGATTYASICALYARNGGTSFWGIQAPYGANNRYQNGGNMSVAPATAAGVVCVAGKSGYADGVLKTSSISAGTGTINGDAWLGAQNNILGGVPLDLLQGSIQAVYIYNVPITPTQVKAVTDAMNMLPMRPQLPRFRSWLAGGAVTQFRKAFGLRTGSRGVPE